MAAAILFKLGAGGNGNPGDSVLLNGSGWTASEMFAANTITVGGAATTHQAFTADSNGAWGPITVTISTALSTTGTKDVIVTGSIAGATTFSGYYRVTEGCGLNDVYRRGDFDKNEYNEALVLDAIADALDEYEGLMYGWIGTDNLPHTVGAYPRLAIGIIADIASSYLWERRGSNPDAVERARKVREDAMDRVQSIRFRKRKLQKPDGTFISVNDNYKYVDVDKNDFAVVTEGNDDDYTPN